MSALADHFRASTRRQREDFISAVENEIALLQDDILPAYESAAETPDALNRLRVAGTEFHKAVSRLGNDARDRLEAAFFVQTSASQTPDERLYSAKQNIHAMDVAAKMALAAATSARRARSRISSGSKDALDKFVVDVAYAYARAFGRAPSWSKTGIFAKLLPSILDQAKIDKPFQETRLKRLIEPIKFAGTTPKRGGRAQQRRAASKP